MMVAFFIVFSRSLTSKVNRVIVYTENCSNTAIVTTARWKKDGRDGLELDCYASAEL